MRPEGSRLALERPAAVVVTGGAPPLCARRREGSRLALERPAAVVVTVVALLVFLNGSLLSAWGALHVDLSINLTAAHALRDGADPYGVTALRERAASLGSPTNLIYGQLFTSYIQPPTPPPSLLPLTLLDWRDATRVYLVLHHVFLLAAYAQINASFALGQVDATILLLLSLGFWGHVRGNAPVTGVAIACAAAIKLIPGLLLLYFLWKREYRVVLWGAGVGLALLLVSLAYVGADVYESYLTETLPALAKGSTHYSNASFGALIARAHTPAVIGGLPEMIYLDEVPAGDWARLAGTRGRTRGRARAWPGRPPRPCRLPPRGRPRPPPWLVLRAHRPSLPPLFGGGGGEGTGRRGPDAD